MRTLSWAAHLLSLMGHLDKVGTCLSSRRHFSASQQLQREIHAKSKCPNYQFKAL